MLSIEEIAEKIRHVVDPDYSKKVHPDHQHLHNVAKQVAEHLDIEPNPLNLNHIAGLIHEHVDRPSAEFPKMKYNHAAKQEMTVESAAEEAALGAEWLDYHWKAPKPEAAAAPREEAAHTGDDAKKDHAAGHKHHKHRAHEA